MQERLSRLGSKRRQVTRRDKDGCFTIQRVFIAHERRLVEKIMQVPVDQEIIGRAAL